MASTCSGLKQGFSSRSGIEVRPCQRELNPSHAISGQWQGPGPLALQKWIPTKTESSETSEVFSRRKWEWYVCIDTQVGSETVTPAGSLNHIYGALLQGFFWSIILICVVLSPFVVYLMILPCVRCDPPSHLSQGGFQWVAWKVALVSLPFWSPRSFLDRKVPLTSRMRNMWSLLYFIWAGPIQPPLSIVLLIFWSFCPHGMNSSCLPPASSSINSLFISSWVFKFLRWLCMPSNACFSSECSITAFFCFVAVFVQECVWIGFHRYVMKFIFSYFAITLYEPVNLFLVLSCGAGCLRALV